MKLNDVEKAWVREHSRDPVFCGIMDKAEEFARVPRYKGKGDEQAKTNAWINRSGFADGIDYMVKLLRYDNE